LVCVRIAVGLTDLLTKDVGAFPKKNAHKACAVWV
jgi:hypothetical protein